jgi:hypothetical protein
LIKDSKNTYKHTNTIRKTLKFAQHVIESGYRFGKEPDILQIKFIGKKGKYLDTMEKFHIYHETRKNNEINDRNTVTYNKIYEVILENQQVY